MLHFLHPFGVKVIGNAGQKSVLIIFFEILVYFNGLVLIFSLCYCILSLTLLCRKFGIAKIRTFWVKIFNLKFWLCQTSNILQV